MTITITTLLLVILAMVVIGVVIFLVVTKPSLSRDWSPDQAVMPEVEFLDDGKIAIKNIRDIHYRTTRDYDLKFYDKTIDLDDLDSA